MRKAYRTYDTRWKALCASEKVELACAALQCTVSELSANTQGTRNTGPAAYTDALDIPHRKVMPNRMERQFFTIVNAANPVIDEAQRILSNIGTQSSLPAFDSLAAQADAQFALQLKGNLALTKVAFYAQSRINREESLKGLAVITIKSQYTTGRIVTGTVTIDILKSKASACITVTLLPNNKGVVELFVALRNGRTYTPRAVTLTEASLRNAAHKAVANLLPISRPIRKSRTKSKHGNHKQQQPHT